MKIDVLDHGFVRLVDHSAHSESVDLQFEVMAPIYVFNHWRGGRAWSFSELDDSKQVRNINHVDGGAVKHYRLMLECGWSRELARSVLPLSTCIRLNVKVNMHSLILFIDRRCPHTRHETRVYAEAMLELIKPIVPAAVEAWAGGKL